MRKYFITRLSRKKYFLYSVLPYLIIPFFFLPILRDELHLMLNSQPGGLLIGGSWIGWIVRSSLIVFISGSIRRLHDIGRSGWWFLLILTSIIFLPLFPLVLLYLIFKGGEKQTNKWGDSN